MKKYISVLFSLILVLGFTLPFFAHAMIPAVDIYDNGGTKDIGIGKFGNDFTIQTVNIPDGGIVGIAAYKLNTTKNPQVYEIINSTLSDLKILNNTASYKISPILEPSTTYKIKALYTNPTKGGLDASDEKTLTTKSLTEELPQNYITINSTKVYDLPSVSTSTTNPPPVDDGTYHLLAPIGGLITAPTNIGDYFNVLFKIAIGICAVLAVVMIVLGGIQYMGDESIFGKTEAKSQITKAIFGLLIALGAYALLNTINPAMLGINGVNVAQVSVDIGGDTDAPIGGTNSLPSGIVCSGGKTNIPNIVNSFSGKMTYQMGAKGVAGPNNTIELDCSGFVNYVLKCANVSFVNGGTVSIFNGAEKVTSMQGTKINNKELGIGDLVGWIAGENSEKYGHVMIYVGNGQVQVADSHGGSTTGNALGVFSITKYQSRIKYIKRAP